MAKITIQHEFDFYEERDEIKDILSSHDYKSLICDIDQEIRSKLKYGEDKWLTEDVYDYLQHIREMIWESGVMRDG